MKALMYMNSPLFAAACGTGFIFLMSVTGGAAVFFFRLGAELRLRAAFLGFAAGVMLAASVWSLLIPSMTLAAALTVPRWLPAACGLILGTLFLFFLDRLIRRLSFLNGADGVMLMTAITLHNIPEGMAVGLAFALARDPNSLAAASALALGIGIQNLPEGAAVSLPLYNMGLSRRRAFLASAASGAVEPLFGMLAVLAASMMHPAMPWLLGFAAGAMLYVCVSELIPESRTTLGLFGFTLGFVVMMILDCALS